MARTPKARALGSALRQAREDKGIPLRELSEAIDKDGGVLSRWETGERTPKPEQVAQILSTLGVSGPRYAAMMTLAYGTNESQWVATTLPERKLQLAAFVDWEQNAARIMTVSPLLVPGILQTRDYVTAIMTAPGVPADEVDSRVAIRLNRAKVLTRRNPVELLVLLGKAALYQGIGGRDVMVGQLGHLLEMAALPHVDIRIVPDGAGWHPGLEGAFTFIEKSTAEKVDCIVAVETRRSDLILHENDDVSTYRWAIGQVLNSALPPDVSLRFIADLRNRME